MSLTYTNKTVILGLNPSIFSSVFSFAPVDTALICSQDSKGRAWA